MTDSTQNSGQFGQREDTKKQASIGGQNSPSQFGGPQGADPKDAGRMGAEAQSTEDKAKGGRNSHQND